MIAMSRAVELYRAGNNAGGGYAPAERSIDEVIQSSTRNGLTLVLDRTSDDEVAVISDGVHTIAIGDSNGPWVVDITSGVGA